MTDKLLKRPIGVENIPKSDHGHGKLEDKLITLFRLGTPDFETADELLKMGVDLNAEDKHSEENVLSQILLGYWQSRRADDLCEEYCEEYDEFGYEKCDTCTKKFNPELGKSMVEIIKYFLNHGFDAARNNGAAGAKCLHGIVLSTFDRYMIEGTKLLLNAGAKNVPYYDDDEETPKDNVGGEASYQSMLHNHNLENIYEAMYQVYCALEEGRPYDGIDSYEMACGKRILKVLAQKPKEGSVFYDIDLPTSKHRGCYTSTLYFVYDGGVLISTKYADFWVDNIIPDVELVDVSDEFSGIVGSVIEDFSFSSNTIVEGTTHYTQPITTITMDNGTKLVVTVNFGEVKNDNDRVAYKTIYSEAE